MLSKIIISFLLGICLFFPLGGCVPKMEKPVHVVKGELDLSSYDFSENPTVLLDGEWKFIWGKWITADEIQSASWEYLPVPSGWEKHNFPVYGFGSYFLKIKLPKEKNYPLHNLGLRIPTISGSYVLFLNGAKVVEIGKIGESVNDSSTFLRPQLLELEADIDEINILFHISNFHDNSSGIWDHIKFGDYNQLSKEYDNRIITTTILASTLFIMGIYHLLFFLNRRSDVTPAYFAFFCIIICIRTLCIDERLVLDIYPNISFAFVHKLEMLSFYLASLVFGFFIAELFRDVYLTRYFNYLKIIFWVLCLLVILFPMRIYTQTLLVAQIVTLLGILLAIAILAIGIKNKYLGGKSLMLGFFLFALTIVNDILTGMGILHNPSLTSFGLILFILFQSQILSRRFSAGFLLAETLAKELQDLNLNLEKKIEERSRELAISQKREEDERKKAEQLLLQILPEKIVNDIKERGYSEPVFHESVTIIFTDFKGFTKIAERLDHKTLIHELELCFSKFDRITEKYKLEKLKTIGDSYMCAAGIPTQFSTRNGNFAKTQAIYACLVAIEILEFMNFLKDERETLQHPFWEIRIGIHTGPVIAGVIGNRKFAYDIWGDTVNLASRLESSGASGKINISQSTFELVQDFFICEYRGQINAKNKGKVAMYYLSSIQPKFSLNGNGIIPNDLFWKKLSDL